MAFIVKPTGYKFERNSDGEWASATIPLPFVQSGRFKLQDAPGHRKLHQPDVEILGMYAKRRAPFASTFIAPRILRNDRFGGMEEVGSGAFWFKVPDPQYKGLTSRRWALAVSTKIEQGKRFDATFAQFENIWKALEFEWCQVFGKSVMEATDKKLLEVCEAGIAYYENGLGLEFRANRFATFAAAALALDPVLEDNSHIHFRMFTDAYTGKMAEHIIQHPAYDPREEIDPSTVNRPPPWEAERRS